LFLLKILPPFHAENVGKFLGQGRKSSPKQTSGRLTWFSFVLFFYLFLFWFVVVCWWFCLVLFLCFCVSCFLVFFFFFFFSLSSPKLPFSFFFFSPEPLCTFSRSQFVKSGAQFSQLLIFFFDASNYFLASTIWFCRQIYGPQSTFLTVFFSNHFRHNPYPGVTQFHPSYLPYKPFGPPTPLVPALFFPAISFHREREAS